LAHWGVIIDSVEPVVLGVELLIGEFWANPHYKLLQNLLMAPDFRPDSNIRKLGRHHNRSAHSNSGCALQYAVKCPKEEAMQQPLDNLIRHPLFVLPFSFFTMWLSANIGVFFRKRQLNLGDDVHQDRDVIVAATLTLLALLIGFSFSMAIGRYDQRKNCEEAEANAIGTEYFRADLLPNADGARVRALLKDYLDQRILFYRIRDERELQKINAYAGQLQSNLWSAVKAPAVAQPTPVLALALSGMNDVLNTQGFTQAAWWNRIPAGAWYLMAAVAICSNLLVGYGARHPQGALVRLLVLPLVLSLAFFLLSDIDTPRRGVIRVLPQNLISLAQSLNGQ
jgi:hypothetical protein